MTRLIWGIDMKHDSPTLFLFLFLFLFGWKGLNRTSIYQDLVNFIKTTLEALPWQSKNTNFHLIFQRINYPKILNKSFTFQFKTLPHLLIDNIAFIHESWPMGQPNFSSAWFISLRKRFENVTVSIFGLFLHSKEL